MTGCVRYSNEREPCFTLPGGEELKCTAPYYCFPSLHLCYHNPGDAVRRGNDGGCVCVRVFCVRDVRERGGCEMCVSSAAGALLRQTIGGSSLPPPLPRSSFLRQPARAAPPTKQTDSCLPPGSTALGNVTWPCRTNLNCSPLYPYCR